MPLDPELEAFLALTALGTQRRMSDMSPQEARMAYDRATSTLDVPGPAMPVEALQFANRDGHALAARLYRGAQAHSESPLPVLLYFHGGGYVLGGLDSHDALCRKLARGAACAVLAVAYRLAPEHKFPAAFQDAEDARLWLQQHGTAHGLDTGRIAYGGDSVGGTLATALTIADRAAGRAQPALQLLLYPCTSAWQDTPSHRRYATGHLLERATLQWMFGHCLRNDRDRADWRFAPLEALSLAGLAPAHIALAEHDPLVDEGQAYARRLQAADVPTQLDVYNGMVHDFARLGGIVDTPHRLLDDLARALRSAFQAVDVTPMNGV